ncbi:hypothetical protein E3N88_44646 [Mikania micrantha]|uniref:Uncharacterized protein n=1 Tax=Mikania micrantha TaxID=192012 RepID=A0A5N6LDT1_9ASTR|nr:hypothetical protein E3N88_44646 [Mikania micrantha]
MVSKKRRHNGGFDGFLSPVVPKAPRSAHKKSSTGSEVCPFELLAAVAGQLLQESGSSVSSTGLERKKQITISEKCVKKEPIEVKINPLRLDYLDHGCCGESEFVPEHSNIELKLEPPLKDLPQSDNDSALEHASIVTATDFLKEVGANVKLEASSDKNGIDGDLCDANMDTNGTKVQTDTVEKLSVDLTGVKSRVNHHQLNKSCKNAHLPFYSDPAPGAYFPRHRKNVKIGHAVKSFDQNRKNIYMRERYQAEIAAKRRKKFHHSSKPDYVQETSSESISNTPKEKAVTSSVINHKSLFQAKDGHVKFSIKSFKVPELYIEMPETSTVGSLKRKVVEAVTAILGGDLHVGVLLQGNKIKDDNTTLQQTGIALNSDTLGFILESNLPQASHKELTLLPTCENHEPLPSLPASPIMDAGFLKPPIDSPVATCFNNQIENNQENKQEPLEVVDTKAIVPVTPLNPEALAIVPLNHKVSKKSELSQRRTRRPFSVSEVEALVEAVETLGTGRWRDVKIRAFDDANHRTYVDLKDKWKTLVHTASISPQQRRGEPVPQDLLDRVLAAHSFWYQNQSKPHGKHQTEPVQTQRPVKVCSGFEA